MLSKPRTQVAQLRPRELLAMPPARSSESGGETTASPKLSVTLVECPYCDGENMVPPNGAADRHFALQDREIACKYCQCLFLLSESKQGTPRIGTQPPDAA